MVLKVGQYIRVSEAEALRFIRNQTSIPVPQVYDAYEREGIGYIFMSKAEGFPLSKLWRQFTEPKRAFVIEQLKEHVQSMRNLTGDFYGSIGHLASEDIFFHHLCVAKPGEQKYGPFSSRKEYNDGLVRALHNSRPPGEFNNEDKTLAARVRALTNEEKIFSHGDLHVGNIFADDDGKVTSIIDWGGAGFSIPERDYLEARLRAKDATWEAALEAIFSDDAKVNYDILKELNNALVRYSGL
ncbi:kinase-like protein [Byssothecium circinans]|uniref:Kinase-like protein n=1 Tax=Byssothecium circinans TaxID=147558 RepID=A0A6A5U3K2_9PLEO|nr:kinase-like protein [Byssothecium circinans]